MTTVNNYERTVTFEIKKKIAVLTQYPTGWSKELNIVCWNGGIDKYDMRDWDTDHEHMSRGITLTEDEAKLLLKALKKEFEKKEK